MTFAAAIPAIVSGGIAERAKFYPMLIASGLIVAFVYPFFEGMIWNGNYGFQAWLENQFGAAFHDFAGSVVVHAVGGWIALAAVHVKAVTAMAAWWRLPPPTFHSWRWAPGFSPSAGSALT